MTAKGQKPGPHARFEIESWDVLRRIMARGDIALGEDYIAGTWQTDDIERLVSLFLLNIDELDDFANGTLLNRIAMVLHNRIVRRNSLSGSKRCADAPRPLNGWESARTRPETIVSRN